MNLNPLFQSGLRHCAYNETRECFLGLHIRIADIDATQLGLFLETLSLKSGEGIWLKPYHGISSNSGGPLDLVYLDEKHRVIETVESFPRFQVNPASPRAATVLVLPVHSIYWSQTQAGDQLMLCEAEEMQKSLRNRTNATGHAGMPLRERSRLMDELDTDEKKKRQSASSGEEPQAEETTVARPGLKTARRLQEWFQRWWSPDPRRAPREPGAGLTIHYWDGGAPKAHGVRDISSTGLYLVTDSRWYPGTVLLMNMQRSPCEDPGGECAIPVHSVVIRSGEDGVGLQFVLDETRLNLAGPDVAGVANRKQLEQFLQSFRKEKE